MLEGCKVRLSEAVQASNLTSTSLDDAWEQSVESVMAAEEGFRQLTKMSNQAQLFEGEVGS